MFFMPGIYTFQLICNVCMQIFRRAKVDPMWDCRSHQHFDTSIYLGRCGVLHGFLWPIRSGTIGFISARSFFTPFASKLHCSVSALHRRTWTLLSVCSNAESPTLDSWRQRSCGPELLGLHHSACPRRVRTELPRKSLDGYPDRLSRLELDRQILDKVKTWLDRIENQHRCI